jgi:hypothetical protein
MRIVLAELRMIIGQDYECFQKAPHDIDHDPALWALFITHICDKLAKRVTGPAIDRRVRCDNFECEWTRTGDREAPGHWHSAAQGLDRLSHRLAKITDVRDTVKLLTKVEHCYEWSVAFRDAFALLSPDRRRQLGELFYKTIAAHIQAGDPTSSHVVIMASGTLTYVANDISGLKDIAIWNDWLERVFDDLPSGMVLVAEPLSYIASAHGKHGAYLKNIGQMISVNPTYRRVDFNERLFYCTDPGVFVCSEARIINVARNISDHLHNRSQFPHLLSHDVGRVIEVYRKLIQIPHCLDLAQYLKDATLKSLAEIELDQAARGRVEDLIEGRRH